MARHSCCQQVILLPNDDVDLNGSCDGQGHEKQRTQHDITLHTHPALASKLRVALLGNVGDIYKKGDKVKTHLERAAEKGTETGSVTGIIVGILSGGITIVAGMVGGGVLGPAVLVVA